MPPTRTLVRGLMVIETLADHRTGMRATEIAEAVGLDKATATRLLSTLIGAGYVTKESAGPAYRLTAKILNLANGVAAQLDLRYLARPHLAALCDEVHEIVHLGVVEGAQVVYIEKLEPPGQSVRLVTAVGQAMPVHSTALGKAILSRLPRQEQETMMRGLDLTAQTEQTITSLRGLRASIDEALRVGYAVDNEENITGAMCVAAAIVGADNHPVAAVSVSSPTFRVSGRLDELGYRVRDAAAAVSKELGGR